MAGTRRTRTGGRGAAGAGDTTAGAGNAPPGGVTVRHYCQGIGDCHLLGFPKADGGTFWMLIDCGVHTSVKGGAARIDAVVADIAERTGKHIDVVVVTHEHTDHTSGFLSARERFAEFTVGEVWLAWTENGHDPQARELDRYKEQALAALQLTSQRLDHAKGLGEPLSALRGGLDALMGFSFGAKGDRVRATRDAAVDIAEGRVRYCEPTDPPVELPAVPNLRIYVLGPPRDAALLGITARSSEMYHASASSGWPIANALAGAFAAGGASIAEGEDIASPFDPNVGTELERIAASAATAVPPDVPEAIAGFARAHYFGPTMTPAPAMRSRQPRTPDAAAFDQSWRRIDLDWLGVGADLAMQLDSRTNNTSLVLAFEFKDSGRVLLFAADAQVGNWLSWQNTRWTVDAKTVTGPDLLARTVYYKVGHHGSHNATLKEKGLELMASRDLAAFIPTNEEDARKVGWGQMPFGTLLDALEDRCDGRVIRADDPWLGTDQGAPSFRTPGGAIRSVRHKPGLWVELDLA
ncbi:MBL fold metallo-hydrolase [Azospirillum sp.]|uniref:MBL fold metallo-hydrolase n=1 Tax=Azospirillum sp. TaxID=34012 RepID=UPI003D71B9F3